ncbi:hypothetical protein DL546_008053 [Coniochaeta pulveracea]|uniref:Uncharacterized protein n=1 Tax=Coniochaeta pulveracea TaxID=177199 RepID=A0A420YLY3_9PEZI|nr:hypothetical protein DL546_008053 [Coniochaeta pulveracea]
MSWCQRSMLQLRVLHDSIATCARMPFIPLCHEHHRSFGSTRRGQVHDNLPGLGRAHVSETSADPMSVSSFDNLNLEKRLHVGSSCTSFWAVGHPVRMSVDRRRLLIEGSPGQHITAHAYVGLQ